MAHFAELDKDLKVIRVVVVNNDVIKDENGEESEQKGIEFCERLFGGTWKQASYSASIRKNYPSKGYEYREDIDAFIARKPQDLESFDKDGNIIDVVDWVLDENLGKWEPIEKTIETDVISKR